MTRSELNNITLELIEEYMDDWSIDEDHEHLVYTLAAIDGVIELKNKLKWGCEDDDGQGQTEEV